MFHLDFYVALLTGVAISCEDLSQLPPEPYCRKQHELATRFITELENAQEFWPGFVPGQHISNALIEARALKTWWYAAWWATWPTADIATRREWARTCREILGPDRWIRGDWPPPVPWWYLPDR